MRSGSPPAKRLRLKTTPEDDIPAADRIFISYRREETAYAAGWLFDRLAERFGPDQIFKDVDSIELGEDFVREINRAVGSTDVLLALIGDRWLTVTDDDGVRRLDHPDDFVRIEIEAALSRDVRIIPILIDGATMPRAAELPRSLAALARRQALELDPARFQSDTSRLLEVLERTLAEQRTPTQYALTEPRAHSEEQESPAAPLAESGTLRTQSDEIAASRRGWRDSVAAHPRLFAGVAAASIAVAAAIALFVTHSNGGANAPPTGGAGASTQEVPSFVDDFSNERYGWENAGPGEPGGRYQDGTYRLMAVREDSADGYSISISSPDVQPSSAGLRIQVDARLVDDTATYARGYGVFCRGDGSQDLYVFSVWKGGAEIGKFTNGSYEVLSPSNADVSSQPGEASKRLEAVCRTTTESGSPVVELEFRVNSDQVATATDPQDGSGGTPLLNGGYGLQAIFGPKAPSAATIDVEFDNFEVSSS